MTNALTSWLDRRRIRAERSRALSPGTRVRVSAVMPFDRAVGMNGRTGTIIKRRRLVNLRRGWVVELDEPFCGGGNRTTVADTALEPIES